MIKAKPATKKLLLPFHLDHCMANFVVAEYMVGCGKCHYMFGFLLTHEYKLTAYATSSQTMTILLNIKFLV